MSELKQCQKCQRVKACWKLGKKSHEKDDKYTIEEFYCNDCLTELDKTKCWKDYSAFWHIDYGGHGQERINSCSDRYNQTERIDKENKDYCRCQVRCDRHKRNFDFNDECKACKDKENKSQTYPRERERERDENYPVEIWDTGIREHY